MVKYLKKRYYYMIKKSYQTKIIACLIAVITTLSFLSITNFKISAASLGNTLNQGNNITVGNMLKSSNGSYIAQMQSDGNFVIYNVSGSSAIPKWNTRTHVSYATTNTTKGSYIRMQQDGNLVVYDSSGKALWHTKTNYGAQSGYVYKLFLTNSGDLELRKCSSSGNTQTTLWTSNKYYDWPVPGITNITSSYGMRNGIMHNGVDISASGISGKNVVAAKSGTVKQVNTSCTHNYGKSSSCGCGGGYGNYVLIEHYDGTMTRYAHCATVKVSVGQKVYNGQTIATVGSTGDSTGYHLHFEVYTNSSTRTNPMSVTFTTNSK